MSRAKAFSRLEVRKFARRGPSVAVKEVKVNVNDGSEADEQLNPRQPQLKVGSALNVRALVKLGPVNPYGRLGRTLSRSDGFLGQHPGRFARSDEP